MKIAIIGTGISGLTCAYLLSRRHEVTVFEANDVLGGHTATVDVEVTSGRYSIDTGFIVFNDWTYPRFIQLLNSIGVSSQPTEMSFSVKSQRPNLEYNGTNLNGLFAQRSNFFKPSFHKMIRDILRFNRESVGVLDPASPFKSQTLGQYLEQGHYSTQFRNHYIIPMGAAIWSASVAQMLDFPIAYFVQFFKNHGMLSVNDRPIWRVIKGGSRAYLGPLTETFKNRISLRSPVRSVVRNPDGVELSIDSPQGLTQAKFDHVVLAAHSDQSLAMLQDSTSEERRILSAFVYQPNNTVLHTDHTLLPKRRHAWAAWNYRLPSTQHAQVAVTYNMNILQGLNAPEVFCVSLNSENEINPNQILRRFVYHHPLYTTQAVAAQSEWSQVSGKNRTHFCGAYWGFGFHEDGVKSGLKVGEFFGETLQ